VDEDDAVDAPTWYADADADGFGDPASPTSSCTQPSGYLADASDCDDASDAIHPGGTEICDGLDNDCDGATDANGLITVDGRTNYSRMRTALAGATSGSTIRVCDGTYSGNLATEFDLTIVSQNGPSSTALEGIGFNGVIDVRSGTLTLSGFTLTGGEGFLSTAFVTSAGGAVLIQSGDPVLIEDCIFESNTAYDGGALAVADGGTVTVTGTSFADNWADGYGGAICAGDAALVLSDVVLEGNSANFGGALNQDGGTLALDATTFEGNFATFGGALRLAGDTEATASADTLITGNSTNGWGGGAFFDALSVSTGLAVTWTGGIFEANTADIWGGGLMVWADDSVATSVEDITCTDNSAAALGGCLKAMGAVTLDNSIVSANRAGWGGGVHVLDGSVAVTGCSVTTNTASHLGGGAYLDEGASLQSSTTDWGSGTTDNSPDDIYILGAAAPFSYGAGGAFSCSDASGTCL
jgi:predicted outer membrane repeat protein